MTYRVKVRVFDDLPAEEITLPDTLQAYAELWARIQEEKDPGVYMALLRLWTAGDQYFLLRYVMSAGRDAVDHFRGEPHFQHPVHIEMARRIQFDPAIDDTVIIGARGLGKSSHFDADDIRTLLVNPNFSIFYFSLTKLLGQKHLITVRTELEKNPLLLFAWPDRLWKDEDERNRAGKIVWSDQALCLKRTTTRPEQSIEAHSFEHALPTGMHPDRRRYDDIEADRSVKSELTAETIKERWISSQNLTSSVRARRTTGTYYSPNALMVQLSKDMGLQRAVFPGEDTSDPVPPDEAGPLGGRPVNGFTRDHLWRRLFDAGGAEQLEDGTWRKKNNPPAMVDYGRQTGCDPLAGEATRLRWDQILTYDGEGYQYAKDGTIVICGDCAGDGNGDSTWIWVWLLTKSREFWWVDSERKVVDPLERRKLIHEVTQRWVNYGANVQQLRLEQFGAATYVQDQELYWREMPAFPAPMIIKCNDNRSPGRGEGKTWRTYERWQPNVAAGKVRFPREMWRVDERGVPINLVQYFKQFEYGEFPKPKTDDGLDAGSLIWEDAKRVGELPWPPERYQEQRRPQRSTGHWQAAGIA